MKTRHCIFFIVLAIAFFPAMTYSKNTLSDSSKISFITCGSGDELYSTFGHSAIRVYDPQNGMDLVFNYGTFDFGDPKFYSKFVRGKLNYFLSIAHFEDFLEDYINENRSVYEQVLNLSTEDHNAVLEYLKENYKEENRFYLYDFFFNNCSTRQLDVLENVLKTRLVYPPEVQDISNSSFRQLTDPYLTHMPWSDFGIDLGLGSPTDRKAHYVEHAYLPDKLKDLIAASHVQIGDSLKPLVKESYFLFNNTTISETENNSVIDPLSFTLILLGIGIMYTLYGFRKGYYCSWFDSLLFMIVGLTGCLLFFLWFGTDHTATVWNYNLLWALPTHVVFALVIKKVRYSSLYRYYLMITIVGCIATVIIRVADIQLIHTATFPLIGLIVLRSVVMLCKIKKLAGFVQSGNHI